MNEVDANVFYASLADSLRLGLNDFLFSSIEIYVSFNDKLLSVVK